MKTAFFFVGLLSLALGDFFPLDLTVGGRYVANGTFTSYNVLDANPNIPFGPPASQPTVWWNDPSTGRYAQDLGNGGFFFYYPDASYVVRNGLCFVINGYTSDTLLATYGRALSFAFDERRDNITFFGVHASTCGTPLSQVWKIKGNGLIDEWIFDQKIPLQIPANVDPRFPNGLNVCLKVHGDIEFSDYERYRNPNVEFPFPALPPQCSNPFPIDYCSFFYFPQNNPCNYAVYPRP